MPKKLILLQGEYSSKDFADEHANEMHTVEEWKRLAAEEHEDLSLLVNEFETDEEIEAYKEAVSDCEDFLSSDFYTFVVIDPELIIND